MRGGDPATMFPRGTWWFGFGKTRRNFNMYAELKGRIDTMRQEAATKQQQAQQQQHQQAPEYGADSEAPEHDSDTPPLAKKSSTESHNVTLEGERQKLQAHIQGINMLKAQLEKARAANEPTEHIEQMIEKNMTELNGVRASIKNLKDQAIRKATDAKQSTSLLEVERQDAIAGFKKARRDIKFHEEMGGKDPASKKATDEAGAE
jgi:hypothetical protein